MIKQSYLLLTSKSLSTFNARQKTPRCFHCSCIDSSGRSRSIRRTQVSHPIFLFDSISLIKKQQFFNVGNVRSNKPILTIHRGCKNALNGFFSNTTSGASQCLNTNGLVGILTAGANTSIVNPVSNFVWPFCAADPCSNQTIQDAETNINSNCGSDFNGVVAGTVESGINFLFNTVVLNAYSTVRDVLCLGQWVWFNFRSLSLILTGDRASQNCIVETLTNIQNAINEPLSLNNVADLPIKVFEGTANITGNFTTLFCTDCIQGNILSCLYHLLWI